MAENATLKAENKRQKKKRQVKKSQIRKQGSLTIQEGSMIAESSLIAIRSA